MKIKLFYIRFIISLALIAILSLQIFWLINMYSSYRHITLNAISLILKESIDTEFMYRQEKLNGEVRYSLSAGQIKKSTSNEIKKLSIYQKDTTYIIEYELDKFSMSKSSQSTMKYIMPLDINYLDSIFNRFLISEKIPVINTAIEFYDKDADSIHWSKPLKKTLSLLHYETDMTFVDLTDSIGLRGHVQTSHFAIFQQMLFQLMISAILIIAVVTCLFRLSKTIFQQRKIEQVKQDFVNAMTHELKRPITSCALTLEYLQQHLNSKDPLIVEDINDSLFSIQKLGLYVEKIQEISKGEDGLLELHYENIYLAEFFEKIRSKYKTPNNKIVNINLNIEKALSLNTDILHFANIIENLIENSIKYSGDQVDIQISAFKKNNHIQISLRDNGWGIPETEIGHIFDKFYRGNSTNKRRKNGFGLGLSYVKIVVENMGGSIEVDSKEKEYTEFTLTLPC